MTDARFKAAERLHGYLSGLHLRPSGLVGPDPGSRFNDRTGRLVKSYLPSLGRRERGSHLEAQAYWILANWRLFDLTGSRVYWQGALTASRGVIEQQRHDGSWLDSDLEPKGRVVTDEGCWAALALLETYRRTGAERALDSAIRWQRYLKMLSVYQKAGQTLAVNYFPHRPSGRIPGHSVTLARLSCELAHATGQNGFLEDVDALLDFVARAQQANGEIPYECDKLRLTASRLHRQCYQHNAFAALSLLRIRELDMVDGCEAVIDGIVRFLRKGIGRNGAVPYECTGPQRNVVYHAGVVAAALEQASAAGFGNYLSDAATAYRYVLGLQQPSGGLPHSSGDFGFLQDRRSYPRYQVMILYHLLYPLPAIATAETESRQSEFAAAAG